MPPFDVAERLARDLYIATAMAGQFETYLVENELFWPLSGNLRGGMPRLTVGGFLLRLHRLDGLHAHMDADQQARYADAKRAFQHGREQWTIHFYGKIDREWEMRVNLLGNFLADCDDRAITGCIANWPNQATQRTILHLLLVESQRRDPSPTAKKADLARLDREVDVLEDVQLPEVLVDVLDLHAGHGLVVCPGHVGVEVEAVSVGAAEADAAVAERVGESGKVAHLVGAAQDDVFDAEFGHAFLEQIPNCQLYLVDHRQLVLCELVCSRIVLHQQRVLERDDPQVAVRVGLHLHAVADERAVGRPGVATEILEAGALLVGSPTMNNQIYPTVADVMTYLKGLKRQNLVGGVFGYYGWRGQAGKNLDAILDEMKIERVGDAVQSVYIPTEKELSACRNMGLEVASRIKA